jgi:hypothetical protein
MSDILSDWASEWNQPDPRITTLKSKLDTLSSIAPSVNSLHDDVEDLKSAVDELLLYHRVRFLYEMDKIDKKELQRLYTMIMSVNEEDKKLAIATVEALKTT